MKTNRNPSAHEIKAAAVLLGRRGGLAGGKVSSEAKTAAARENGKKGGRPRKVAPECQRVEL